MFPDGDMQAFADWLARLHDDPVFRQQMVEKARRFTRDHAWENEFAGYVKLLERLLSRPVAAAPARG